MLYTNVFELVYLFPVTEVGNGQEGPLRSFSGTSRSGPERVCLPLGLPSQSLHARPHGKCRRSRRRASGLRAATCCSCCCCCCFGTKGADRDGHQPHSVGSSRLQ